jgi:hypothetical protein
MYSVYNAPYQSAVPTTSLPASYSVSSDPALVEYVNRLAKEKEGLESVIYKQQLELSRAALIQQQNVELREKIEAVTTRCYHQEEAVRFHERDKALLMGLRSKNESLQINCNTFEGRCRELEDRVAKQNAELERINSLQVENASLVKSNAFFKGRCDEIELLFVKQRDEVAAAASLRTENTLLRSSVKAMEAKINNLERILRDKPPPAQQKSFAPSPAPPPMSGQVGQTLVV